jgi:hypothetical protein
MIGALEGVCVPAFYFAGCPWAQARRMVVLIAWGEQELMRSLHDG